MRKAESSSTASEMSHAPRPDRTQAQVCDAAEPVPMEVDQPAPVGTTAVPCQLHACETCHSRFLTKHGLDQHLPKCPMLHRTTQVVMHDTLSQGVSRSHAPKTIKDMLAMPPIDHPVAAKMNTCPICKTLVGRKALCAHVKKEHQVDRPSAFSFEPEHDQLPGELACKHCYGVFTMDFALQTHFRRASCPVLFCQWLSKQHFGPSDSSTEPCHQVPSTQTSLSSSPLDTTCGLVPLRASSRTDDCPLNGLLWTPHLLFIRSLSHTPSFDPELHIRWYVTSVRWSAHCCELPHTCFPADQVFRFLADLEHFVPVIYIDIN